MLPRTGNLSLWRLAAAKPTGACYFAAELRAGNLRLSAFCSARLGLNVENLLLDKKAATGRRIP
jgi:hypothetical protein